MSRYNTFRDDDISVTTDIGLLMKTHDLIISYGKIHTVSVLMKDLWDNKEVWLWLMTAKNLSVGLHGWTHLDYSRQPFEICLLDIRRSLDYWQEHTGAYPDAPRISMFYPPWNRSSMELELACRDCGLVLDNRWKKDTPVYGFHSWEMFLPDRWAALEKALRA